MIDVTGRREQTKTRTRAALIEAGIRLMHAQGYAATATTQIAAEAGVAPATLFNYFPTKASIVFADDHLWAPPEGIDPGVTPRETLTRVVQAMVSAPGWTHTVDDPLTRKRFELVRREPDLAREQDRRLLAMAPSMADLLERLHPDLSRGEAIALSGALLGAIAVSLQVADDPDVRATITRATRAALG